MKRRITNPPRIKNANVLTGQRTEMSKKSVPEAVSLIASNEVSVCVN